MPTRAGGSRHAPCRDAAARPNTRGGDSVNDWDALESELAPETEVALEVSRRMPVLLMVAVVLIAIVCWRRMR
jgi:hypothetical protein